MTPPVARYLDPWLRWLPLLAALLLLAAATIANAQGVALPVDAVCLIQCSDGSAGTGVLVDVTEGTDGQPHGLVLTNQHVCRDAIARNGTYAATFPGLRKHGATLVAYNAELDLAALEIVAPPVEPSPLTDALEGETFYTAGLAGNVNGLRVTCGRVVAEEEAGRQISFVIDAPSRAGDSGGPVFDAKGRLCGIRWGTSGPPGATQGPDTYLVDPSQVAAFLREIGVEQTGVATQQWPGSVCSPCQPGGSCSPFAGVCSPCQPMQPAASSNNVCQQNPDGTWSCPGASTRPAILPGTRILSPRTPRNPSPSTPSAPSAPSPPASTAPASCDCTDKLAAIDKRITDLEQRKPEPGPAGPAGPVGPAGPAGKDGAAATIDEEGIAQRVAAIVLAQQQPSSQVVSHYVLVADEQASYWPRLSDEYRRAREVYSQIRLSGVPSVPVGALPQLVAYRDGKPLGAFRGARDVSDALVRIARNEPPQP